MVQAFTPNRTDDPFDVSALPRRPRNAENFFDIHYRDLIAELLAIDSISISHQISRRRIEGKGFKQLLRRPFGCRVSRNVEVNNASLIMCENHEDKQHFKPNGVDSKEVDGRELRNVIIEERSPGLRWWLWTPNHVFGDRSLRDINAQLHQLAVDPRCAPNWVLTADRSNQIADLFRDLRTSGFSETNFPSPIPTESLTMPSDAGLRTGRFVSWVRWSTVN